MSFPRRTLGCIASVAGVVGVIVCVSVIAGCWIAHARFVDWLDRTYARVDTSLRNVRVNLNSANERLRHTQNELAEVRRKAAEPDERVKGNLLFRTAVETHKPELHDARNKLVVATEAGLILQGILEAFTDLNLGDHVETDRVKTASTQLSELIVRAEKVTSKLDGVGPADPEPSEMMEGFDKLVRTLDDGDARLEGIRKRTDEWHRCLHRDATIAALAITLISLWIGLGQWSLAFHGRRWGQRLHAVDPHPVAPAS